MERENHSTAVGKQELIDKITSLVECASEDLVNEVLAMIERMGY